MQETGTASDVELRNRLLQEIENTAEESRNGAPVPGLKALLEEIKATAEQDGGFKVRPDIINGEFKGLINTTVLISKDGTLTLGTLTFQQFGPRDLKVKVESGTGGLYQGGETPNKYAVKIGFKVTEGDHKGLVGLWSVIGHYEVDKEKPDRQITHFTGIQMEPVDTSPEGLKAWLDLMASSNPSMDQDGVVKGSFEKAIRGHRDFIYLDQDYQVQSSADPSEKHRMLPIEKDFPALKLLTFVQ